MNHVANGWRRSKDAATIGRSYREASDTQE
jgi:hypothetical protein